MVFRKSLTEAIIHHGSFKDLQTFLDKDGNPIPLVKYIKPEDNDSQKNQSESGDNSEKSSDSSNQKPSSSNSSSQNSSSESEGDSDEQQSSSQSDQDQTKQNSDQQEQSNQDTQSQQRNQKQYPDPTKIYLDVRTGKKYKFDTNSNTFNEVRE